MTSQAVKTAAESSRKGLLLNLLLALLTLSIGACLCEGMLRLKNSSMRNYDIEMWRYAKELKFRSAG